jgi:hypothetical protein
MIIQPTLTRGQYDSAMGKNIDQLCEVQKGVRRRGNLITAAINHREGAEELEETLRADFDKNVNETRLDDEIELLSFSAVDELQVEQLFNQLLKKLSNTLAIMDAEILEYTKTQKGSIESITSIVQNIYYCTQKILKEIPLVEDLKFELLNEIANNLRYEYGEFESDTKQFATQESEWSKEYKVLVQTIHSDCGRELKNGFFRGSKTAWVKSIKGASGDYVNCYRQEAERVRRELISSYDRLNEYYTSQLDKFKNAILNIFLSQTYKFKDLIVAEDLSINEVISKLIAELSGSVRDDDFIDAFRLLLNMNFQFRQNVFYNLAPCLEELSNAPDEIYNAMVNSNHQGKSLVYDMRPLGEIGVPFANVEPLMEKGLNYLANEANDAIKDALLNYDDKFNQYVFICAQFFNDYLFRKDEEKFKNVNIRSFVDSYKNYIVDASEQQVDADKERLLRQIMDSIKDIGLRIDFGSKDSFSTKSSAFVLDDSKAWNTAKLPPRKPQQESEATLAIADSGTDAHAPSPVAAKEELVGNKSRDETSCSKEQPKTEKRPPMAKQTSKPKESGKIEWHK